MSSLLVIKGPNIGVRYDLGERTRIGRLSDNEVPIADPNVSRLHAEIVRNRLSYTIHDNHSKNGVLVNGRAVQEHLLLRNDEVQIGPTVFLFNSDLSIRNARFSNNSVYLYPSADETVADARRRSATESLQGRDRESIEFILRFAELFAAPPASLPETSEHLAAQVLELFRGDAAVLLIADRPGGELRPVVALPAGQPAALSRNLIATVAEEQTAMLTCEPAYYPTEEVGRFSGEAAAAGATKESRADETAPGRSSASSIQTPDPTDCDVTTICAPILQNSETVAVIAVEKRERDFYSLRDLGLLQAVAKLAAGMLHAATLADRLAAHAKESERSAAATRDMSLGGESVPTRSSRLQEIFAAARRAADSDVTVLITGESGTGKELLARHIHENSKRRQAPFVIASCASTPQSLVETELFGYEKGAFPGAAKTTSGKIEAAHTGTLLIEDVSELDPSLQPRLLQFLQDRAFYRIGGSRAIDVDVRVIAATSADLTAAVREGRFREDLWYRLNVVTFHMPPLRERREDIAPLIDKMVVRSTARLGRKILGVNDAALSMLQKYDWPGNIREMENAVDRAVLLAEGKILTIADFSHIDEARRRATVQADIERKRETRPLSEIERGHIIAALKRNNYNQARTAEALGMHRNTLRNKIIEYGIELTR